MLRGPLTASVTKRASKCAKWLVWCVPSFAVPNMSDRPFHRAWLVRSGRIILAYTPGFQKVHILRPNCSAFVCAFADASDNTVAAIFWHCFTKRPLNHKGMALPFAIRNSTTGTHWRTGLFGVVVKHLSGLFSCFPNVVDNCQSDNDNCNAVSHCCDCYGVHSGPYFLISKSSFIVCK